MAAAKEYICSLNRVRNICVARVMRPMVSYKKVVCVLRTLVVGNHTDPIF